MLEDGTHASATQEGRSIGGWDMQDAMAMRWIEAVEEVTFSSLLAGRGCGHARVQEE